MMSHSVSYTKEDDIGIITVTNPPVNALSQHVRQGLAERFAEADKDNTIATVLICAGRTFIAGADITEFGKPLQPPNFLDTMEIIENLSSRLWLPSTARPWAAASKPRCAAIIASRCHRRGWAGWAA